MFHNLDYLGVKNFTDLSKIIIDNLNSNLSIDDFLNEK